MKRYIIFSVLLALVLVFVPASWSVQKVGSVAIFTESVSWTDVGTANAAAQIIADKLKLTRDVQVLNNTDIATFATKNTKDGDLDIIITFGYFPPSIYKPVNAEPDNSIAEKFLEGGDMFINSADYIFYVSSAVNGDAALKNITDSTFDMWCDDNAKKNTPTDDGKKYAPSIPAASTTATRSFKTDQIEANKDWEVEGAFSSNGGTYIDPAVIHNKVYDGRVGIVFQTGDATPRGEVITEILNNWLSQKVKAQPVENDGKLPVTWGKIKNSI
jgi:hypothetical protein